MTEAEYHDALHLLDSATELLRRRDVTSPAEFVAEIRRLTLALDLLKLRVTQAPPESQRN